MNECFCFILDGWLKYGHALRYICFIGELESSIVTASNRFREEIFLSSTALVGVLTIKSKLGNDFSGFFAEFFC